MGITPKFKIVFNEISNCWEMKVFFRGGHDYLYFHNPKKQPLTEIKQYIERARSSVCIVHI